MLKIENFKTIKMYDLYYITDENNNIIDLPKNNIGFKTKENALHWFNDFVNAYNKSKHKNKPLETFCTEVKTSIILNS